MLVEFTSVVKCSQKLHRGGDLLRKLIFVGGIHGVGKTHLCQEICRELNIPHFSASDLIRKQKEEKPRLLKNVTDVQGNQEALIMGIDSYVADVPTFLLDGHFCILNKEGEVERIPQSTFEKLQISRLLVLVDDPGEIQIRLKSRDSSDYSIDLLNRFQTEELEYANQLSSNLMIPVFIHKNGENESRLYDFLNKYI